MSLQYRAIRLSVGLLVVFAMSVGMAVSQDARSAKRTALNWIDGFAENQVLFHEDDIATLRKELTEGTEKLAADWLARTKESRAALDSPEWQETRKWLTEFLKVQAIYSDKEIDKFRTESREAAQESPKKLIDVLKELDAVRAKLVSGAANADKQREIKLHLAKAYQDQQVELRDQARRQAATRAAAAPPNTGTTVKKPKVNYSTPKPLVTSIDVARRQVMRNFWRPRVR